MASSRVSLERSHDSQPFLQSLTLRWCSATSNWVRSAALSRERSQDPEPFLQAERFRSCPDDCAKTAGCKTLKHANTIHNDFRILTFIVCKPFLIPVGVLGYFAHLH